VKFPYLPHTEEDRQKLMQNLGIDDIEELFTDIPAEIKIEGQLPLERPQSELEVKRRLRELSAANEDLTDYTSFLGAGVYDHYMPSTIDHILSRSEFYTAYTPYQAEISQGYLQAIFEYQTMICELTGMDVANASMYDGASALAEAALMAIAAKRRRRTEIVISAAVNPQSKEVVSTYCRANDLTLTEVDFKAGSTAPETLAETVSEETAAVLVQNPNFFGQLEDLEELAAVTHEQKALFVVNADPISLGLLEAPGKLGADIVVGEGQSLGNPLNFGGPHFGFFAATERYMRKMPGRIVGATEDTDGKRGFALTLQTREQHIRRERATSNICSNQALNALAATVYLTLLGPTGLREAAEKSFQKAHYAANRITELEGYELLFAGPYVKEFAVKLPISAHKLNDKLRAEGIIGGYDLSRDYQLENSLLVAVTEKRTKAEIDNLLDFLEAIT